MEIIEVTNSQYKEIIPAAYNVFCTPNFNELNKEKCISLHYLLFNEGKYRLGIIGGIKNNTFFSPFSAPFGGFTFLSNDIKLFYIDEALQLLNKWALKKKLASLYITLPPPIYNATFIAKQENCLFRDSYEIIKTDLNYSFNLENLNENYLDTLWYNAKKNLRIALNADLKFEKCNTLEAKTQAYNIIKKNRNSKGYPLRMTWQDVEDTIKIIPADLFLVSNSVNNFIASAIIFHTSNTIVQVIYWGDLPEYSSYKTMNFLSYKVFEYYKSTGIKIVDIGPSTDNSIPNYGLCEFKESIGCNIEPKLSFTKNLL